MAPVGLILRSCLRAASKAPHASELSPALEGGSQPLQALQKPPRTSHPLIIGSKALGYAAERTTLEDPAKT